MLQRKQTLYMLASVIAVMMMLILPSGLSCFSVGEQDVFFLSGLGLSSVMPEVYPIDVMRYGLLLILLLMLALPLVCIFMYKHRKLQVRMLLYAIILDVLFFGYMFLYELPACEGLADSVVAAAGQWSDAQPQPELGVHYQFVLFAMPLVSIFACIMAVRGVLYDIALLASADRLRSYKRK